MNPQSLDEGRPLSDEEFAAQLFAPARAEGGETELHALHEAVANYRSESLVWAERRSSTEPSLVAAGRKQARWAAVPQWSMAAVALLTVSVGVLRFAAGFPNEAPAGDSRMLAGTNTSAVEQMAADNVLLHSIDAALQYDAPVNASGLELATPIRMQAGNEAEN